VNMYRFCQLLKHKLPLNNLKQPVGNNVRQYFKPSQGKDAFFDVEGVVTKDVLLFRYDDSGKVFWINLIAMGMFPIWTYMGYTAYSLKSAIEPVKDATAENTKLNWRIDHIMSGSWGIGLAYCLFGVGLSSYWVTRTMNTVRRLVLRKGGKYISIQTYGITGGGGKIFNVPVVHCSGAQQEFHKTDRFFLKIRDHSFKYQLNLKDGVVSNMPLFARTVGLGRTI